MNRTFFVFLSAIAVLFVSATADETQPSDKPLSVTQFGRANVVGFLGKPLGTVVRATGIVVDGDTTRCRIDAGKTLLEVREVNGIALERPIRFDHPFVRNRLDSPKPGARFDYFVHEHGCFGGFVDIPADVDSDQPMVAHDGFGYRSSITIHSKQAHDQPLKRAKRSRLDEWMGGTSDLPREAK